MVREHGRADTMNQRSIYISAIEQYVRHYMSQFDASHDYNHIERVVALAKHILHMETEEQPDLADKLNETVVWLAA